MMEQGRKKDFYRALLFDIDNTLLNFDASEAEVFKKLLIRFGMNPEDRLVEEYHQINRYFWEQLQEGKMGKDEVLTKRFEVFFSRHGKRISGEEAENFYRLLLGGSAVLIHGAAELCRDLGEKYLLYIVTNGEASTQYLRLNKSGLKPFFDGVFVSEEAGSPKPQKAFFDYCFKQMSEKKAGRLGIKREEMLLIGDSLTSDMRGGRNAGIDTCWYNPGHLKNDSGIFVTMEVDSYEELRSILL